MRKTIEEAYHLRNHQDVKHIFAIRKETIERVWRCKRKAWYALDYFKGNLLTFGQNSKGNFKGVRNFLIPNPFCPQTETRCTDSMSFWFTFIY
jgi:hypothetical protein